MVATAGNPHDSNARALKGSQALGKTRMLPRRCNSRRRSALARFVSMFMVFRSHQLPSYSPPLTKEPGLP